MEPRPGYWKAGQGRRVGDGGEGGRGKGSKGALAIQWAATLSAFLC